MADVEKVLDEAGLKNPQVREYVRYWADLTGASRVEVVSAADDARLIQESLDSGELLPAGDGRYYSRSYYKDTARSEERTIVATSDAEDRGTYNNWQPAAEMKPLLESKMRGASAGKTMYVIPYLMAPPGSPAREVRRRRRAHRPPHRRAAHDPHGPRRRRAHREPRRPGQLRARRSRHRRPREPRPGHPGRPALLRDRRRRADHPALRVVVRRQRPARQDRPRAAPGGVRRLGVGQVPRRAVHAAGHHRQGDRPQVQHLRRVPERVWQDQPGDDAGAGRARRPLPRGVLRRRHRLAVGRRGRPALRDEPGERRLRRRQGHQRAHQPGRAGLGCPRHRRLVHQRRLQRRHPRSLVGRQDARAAGRRSRLAGLEGPADRRPHPRAGRRTVGAPEQPVHHHAGQRAQRRGRLRGPAGRPDRRDHLRRPDP